MSYKRLIFRTLLFILIISSHKLACKGQQVADTAFFRNFNIDTLGLRFDTKVIKNYSESDCYYKLNSNTEPVKLIMTDDDHYEWRIKINRRGENDIRIFMKDSEGFAHVFDTGFIHHEFGYWVLSVGTDGGRDSLKCSIDDARQFTDEIENMMIPYKPELSYCITDTHATGDSIRNAFLAISKSIKESYGRFDEKAVFVYLSGHGYRESNKFHFDLGETNDIIEDSLSFCFKELFKSIRVDETLVVWVFVDSCESSSLSFKFPYSNDSGLKNEEGSGYVVVFSSTLTNGNKYKIKEDVEKLKRNSDYCAYIKGIKTINKLVEPREANSQQKSLLGSAIDGLYMNFFSRTIKDVNGSIGYKKFGDMVAKYYSVGNNKKTEELLVPPKIEPVNGRNEESPSFPFESYPSGIMGAQPSPVGFIDVAIGWNLSRQWNPQIGYSWPRWSVFVDFSGRKKWTNTITHTGIPESDTLARVLPSRYIVGMGLGARWYPNLFCFGKVNSGIGLVNLGLGLSAQTGIIYGEKRISEVETVKHKQSYACITPTLSIKAFVSRRHRFMWYFNVGYACYIHPYSINHELELKPFVANFGISIPVCFKNKTTTGEKR